MSRLATLQMDLQEVSAAIARAERTLAAHPDTPSALATLQTFTKRRENLEAEFLATANELGLDVCSYRIELPDSGRATIAGMTAVLGTFQKIFSSVYHALANGPKQTAKVSAETTQATAFEFAYTFPGSIGVMMTLPNDRLLFASQLDEAMDKTLALISAPNPLRLHQMADVVGVPTLRLAHEWATENAKAGFGVDVVWGRGDQPRQKARVQPQQIQKLASDIKSVTAKETLVVVGELLEVSLIDRTFRMSVEGKTIQGVFTTVIGHTHPVELPKVYQATLEVQQKVVVSEGEQDTLYLLRKLEPPPSRSENVIPALPGSQS